MLYKQLPVCCLFSDGEEEVPPHSKWKNVTGVNGHGVDLEDIVDGRPSPKHQLKRIISIEEDHLPHLLQQGYQAQLRQLGEDEEFEEGIDLQMSNIYPTTSTPTSVSPPPDSRDAHTPTSPRGQPVGKETVQSVRQRFDDVCLCFSFVFYKNTMWNQHFNSFGVKSHC